MSWLLGSAAAQAGLVTREVAVSELRLATAAEVGLREGGLSSPLPRSLVHANHPCRGST